MTEIEFMAWPKTPRLNREMIVTEKIDGTNACVIVSDDGRVAAQSRKRLIEPGDDNYGFAKFVHERAGELADALGPGHHFGEWWGHGIQRGYGLPKGERFFSLFNVDRWADASLPDRVLTVPLLHRGPFCTEEIDYQVSELDVVGSRAADFDRPEGVIVYHTASNSSFKVLIEGNEGHKGE